ncbi:MAG: hypothetical protein IIA61_07960 [Candidatus Marinimicrobia bacterium]|nr:hypothetical protein [Candidatus Neomarinimicrobiota bacterium]
MSIRKQFISIFILFLYTCEWPFNTTPTDKDEIFTLTLTHDIVRLVDTAFVRVSWPGISIEEFSEFTVERMMVGDTTWTLRASLTNQLFTFYDDVVNDDEDFRYRVSIKDIQGNMKWAEGETIIPKTTSLFIPEDYDAIQNAFVSPVIDDGDSIIVAPGVYKGTLSIMGKQVLVQSIGGYEVTVIMASENKRCVNINNGILVGFRLEGGTGGEGANTPGGGVYASGNAVLRNNFIVGNVAPGEGGGVFITGNANLYNNIIVSNVGNPTGGIFIDNATGNIINNTVVGDFTGGVAIRNSTVDFLNNIIFQQEAFDLLVFNDALQSEVAYCRFKEVGPANTLGNISANPLFIDSNTEDFQLHPDSPCVDAGHPGDEFTDRDGSRNDMGVFGGPYGG